MDSGLGKIKTQSPPGISKGGSSLNSAITQASSSSKIGIGITQATTPSSNPAIIKTTPSSNPAFTKTTPSSNPAITNAFPSRTVLKKMPAPKQEAPAPKQEPLTPNQEKLKGLIERVNWNRFTSKVNRQANIGKKNPTPNPRVSGENALAFITSVSAEAAGLAIYGTKVIMEETPKQVNKLLDEVTAEVEAPMVEAQSNKFPTRINPTARGITGGMTEDMTGGTPPIPGGTPIPGKATVFNRMLFATAYIPGILTLFAFFFLLFFLLWAIIMGLLNRFLGDKYALPSVKFDKKQTQTVYSIFFAITSLFLMLYLVIDYFRKLGPELDIVQIFKQLVGASYILWPMSVLIIGSGIAKAFYKISCSGNKPNLLSWAKIVESSALYILGICVLITILLLLKPINWIYKKTFPDILKHKFTNITNLLAVTLKLMVIYILLRMITIMIEDVISNKIVFFISKLNKDIEPLPVDCNAVIEEKNAKQSEVANIMKEIYMYITGIIVCIIIIFILVIQCPHPYINTTIKLNHKIGSVILKLTGIATKFIVENKDRQVDCNENKKASGFGLSNLVSSFGKAEQPPSDDAGAIAAYSRNINNPESAFTPSEADGTGATGYINKRIILINESPTAFKSSGADGTGATGHINRVNESPTAFKPNKADGRDSTQEPTIPNGRLKSLDINRVGTSKIQSLTTTTPLAPIPPTSTAETGADITSEKI